MSCEHKWKKKRFPIARDVSFLTCEKCSAQAKKCWRTRKIVITHNPNKEDIERTQYEWIGDDPSDI